MLAKRDKNATPTVKCCSSSFPFRQDNRIVKEVQRDVWNGRTGGQVSGGTRIQVCGRC